MGRILWLALVVPLAGADTDYFPQIRTIVKEAEVAALQVRDVARQRQLLGEGAKTLAQAGYLEESERLANLSHERDAHRMVGIARAFYGDYEGGLRVLESLREAPLERAQTLERLATILWRVGDKRNAGDALGRGEEAAKSVTAGPKKATLMRSLQLQRDALNDDPPIPLHRVPRPARTYQPKPDEPFPVARDLFRDANASAREDRMKADAAFLDAVYPLLSEGKNLAAMQAAERAGSAWQRAWGLAAVAQMTALARNWEYAVQAGMAIPRDKGTLSLARAGVLRFVGVALTKAKEVDRARGLFQEAAASANDGGRGQVFDKVTLLVAIAVAQHRAGFVEDAKTSFNLGLVAAKAMPQNVARRNRLPSNYKEFREGGLGAVFSGQLDVLDTAAARTTAETWFRLETPYDGDMIVSGWIRAEQVEEALRFARGIRERDLAAQLLNHAAEVVLREAVSASW
jgi:hypothetical protein